MPPVLKKNLIISIPALVAALIVIALNMHGPSADHIKPVLHEMGAENAQIGGAERAHGYVVFSDITLDKDGFSTIDQIKTRASWLDMIRKRPFHDLILDGLILTGALGNGGFLSINGWDWRKVTLPGDSSIDIRSGQLDLLTTAGAIRLEGKAQILQQENSTRQILAAIHGTQHQLRAKSRWEGIIHGPNQWHMDIALEDGRLNLDHIKASRVNGWISSVRNPEASAAAHSSQISFGSLHIGDTLLAATTLTYEGSMNQGHLIIKGRVAPYEGMSLFADIRRAPREISVTAAIETQKLDDLFDFLQDIRNTAEMESFNMSFLMPFLLTEGNLSRVKNHIKSTPHNTLELQINGTLADLTAKIVAKQEQNGTIERRIISLNPAEPPL